MHICESKMHSSHVNLDSQEFSAKICTEYNINNIVENLKYNIIIVKYREH